MKKALLNAIAIRLQSKLNETTVANKFGNLNYIARFRNQFNDTEETIPSPAIAIEFPSVLFQSIAKGQQEVSLTVRIHCHVRNLRKQRLTDGQLLGTEELEYQDEIHKALQGWKPDGFTTFNRVESNEDINYDFAITDTISYETSTIDTSADKRNDYEEITPELEVKEDVINIPPEENPYNVEL